MKTGVSAEVSPENAIGGTYTAKVTVVDHVLDAASSTFGVRLELPNPQRQLPAGVKCKARIAGLPDHKAGTSRPESSHPTPDSERAGPRPGLH